MRVCLGCGIIQNIPSYFDDDSEKLEESESEITVGRE